MLRVDMDGLSVREETGLAYASSDTAPAADGTEAEQLAAEYGWRGRVVLVFQPDEEGGTGARSMIADGLLDRFGTPHTSPGRRPSRR